MLIFSHAPLFIWAEAIATACFTQNQSNIHRRFNKTPYELINERKPDISFLDVFGALCYPKNDCEDIRKLGAKGDIGFFIGYSADSCTYRVYNQRTKKIIETMNVSFDELSAMAFEQRRNANLNGNGNLVAARAKENAAGHNGNQIRCYNYMGVGHFARNCMIKPRRRDDAYLQTQLLIAQKKEAGIQLQTEEFDLMAATADLDEMKEVNANYGLLDKQIQLEKKIKELNIILVKMGQSIQTIHMLLLKPDSFYNIEQKMALGYQNPFYLKQAQKKQQSLYDGKLLLEKHDPPVVHDSEETLQLAQESREKMKQLNKEIKLANYTKINHLSRVLVSQTAKSREELYFLNDSITANVSKSISIPNAEISDDTTPSVAHKFLNEFLKEAAKFVGDFKSLAKEADESLAKHKALELEIKRLLRAVFCHDIMSVDKAYKDMQQKIEWLQAQLGDLKGKSKDTSCVSDTLNPLSQKLENENVELEFQDKKRGTSANTKFVKQSIVKNLPKVGETHALSKPVTSNSVPTPQESKVVKNNKVISPGMFRINPFKTSREAKHMPNNIRASARTKPITVSQSSVITKKYVNSDSNGLSSTGIDNTKTRRP
nr:retrovirus-related Pol polyprotein from transposon TNT 1-94 [Tanacetum cinerariifolium]